MSKNAKTAIHQLEEQKTPKDAARDPGNMSDDSREDVFQGRWKETGVTTISSIVVHHITAGHPLHKLPGETHAESGETLRA